MTAQRLLNRIWLSCAVDDTHVQGLTREQVLELTDLNEEDVRVLVNGGHLPEEPKLPQAICQYCNPTHG